MNVLNLYLRRSATLGLAAVLTNRFGSRSAGESDFRVRQPRIGHSRSGYRRIPGFQRRRTAGRREPRLHFARQPGRRRTPPAHQSASAGDDAGRYCASVFGVASRVQRIANLRPAHAQGESWPQDPTHPEGQPIASSGRIVGKPEVETPHLRRVRLHGPSHQQQDAQRSADLYVKRLAGDESAVASAPPPTSGRAPRGSPAAARRACPSA